jgi:hypothetical protein
MQAGDIELFGKTADLIIKYGFLGVGLVLTLGIAPLAGKMLKSKTLTLTIASFGIAFLVAWGVLDIVQRYFPSLISSKRVLLSGVVLKVPNGYQVQIASDLRTAGAAYLRRENDVDNRELTNFPFLLLATQSPNCLALGITNNNPKDEGGSSAFKIALKSDGDFKSEVALIAQAQPDAKLFKLKVWREVDGKTIGNTALLEPLGDNNTSGCAVSPSAGILDWLMPSAFAQSANSEKDFSVRLKSDDLFTRRDARIDLSRQGRSSVGVTREFLNSDNYRLQLGALVALSIMPEEERKELPPDVIAKVRELKTSPDATIRETAGRIEVRR